MNPLVAAIFALLLAPPADAGSNQSLKPKKTGLTASARVRVRTLSEALLRPPAARGHAPPLALNHLLEHAPHAAKAAAGDDLSSSKAGAESNFARAAGLDEPARHEAAASAPSAENSAFTPASGLAPAPKIGSPERPYRVAVIGAGPSGFYSADALLKQKGLAVRVDVFDRQPTPFGLVRTGVAPDHQDSKGAAALYEKIASKPGFRFFGNVDFGKDVSIEDLSARYDHIVLAVGQPRDRPLGVPGEDFQNSHPASEFFGWYNGVPEHAARKFDLSGERAVVIGAGNVALDIVRILASDPSRLRGTDIPRAALAQLSQSRIKEIVLLGRGSPDQATFFPEELEELAKLPGVDLAIEKSGQAAPESEPAAGSNAKKIRIKFWRTTQEIEGKDGKAAGVRVIDARTGDQELIRAGLVIRAVGFEGKALPGVPFDGKRIPSDQGRVVDPATAKPEPGLYVAGWAKNGARGIIGQQQKDAAAVVKTMVEDLASAQRRVAEAPSDIAELLKERGVRYVDAAGWKRIDQAEREAGAPSGMVREKLLSRDELVEVAHGGLAARMKKGLSTLFNVQFFTVLNDQGLKTLFMAWAKDVLPMDAANLYIGTAFMLFTLPYILYSVHAGRLADSQDHAPLIRLLKRIELAVNAFTPLAFAVALAFHLSVASALPAFALLFAMGLHSAFMSPTKETMVPAMSGPNHLAESNAKLGFSTFSALVAGTVVGIGLNALPVPIYIAAFAFPLLSWIGLRTSLALPRLSAAGPAADPTIHALWERVRNWSPSSWAGLLREDWAEIRRLPDLLGAGLGLSFLWGVGGMIQMNMATFVKHGLHLGDGWLTTLVSLMSAGMAMGMVWAGKLSKGRVELGFIPLALAALLLAPLDVAFFGNQSISRLVAGLLIFSVSIGLAMIPLNAHFLAKAPENGRGRLVGTSNLLIFGGLIAGSLVSNVFPGLNLLLSAFGIAWSFSPFAVFYAAALLTLPVAVAASYLLRAEVLAFARRVIGKP